jgi:hypothetical protein
VKTFVQLLGAVGIVTLVTVIGAVGSCMIAGTDSSGIPGAGSHADSATITGAVVGLALGIFAAFRQFRR